MGSSRQEYLSGLPFPPPGDLPNPGMESGALASPVLTDRSPHFIFSLVLVLVSLLKDFPGGSDGKASAYNARDPGSIPGLGQDPLEKEMATHSSTLAWRMPWMEEPGRLPSMGSQRVGHN